MKRAALVLLLVTACRSKPPAVVTPIPTPPIVAARTAPARTCGIERGILRGDRVGALRLGMTAAQAKELCTIVRDTLEDGDGDRERFLIILAGSDTLRAHVANDSVDAILVASPRFQTIDSIGVGVPLGRLLRFRDLSGDYGHEGLVVWSNAPSVCGLSFVIEFRRPGVEIRNVSPETLLPYAETAKIKSIFARGCER